MVSKKMISNKIGDLHMIKFYFTSFFILSTLFTSQVHASLSCEEFSSLLIDESTLFQSQTTRLYTPTQLVFVDHKNQMLNSKSEIAKAIESLNKTLTDINFKLSPEQKSNRRQFDKRWFAAKGASPGLH